ncbi:MAG: ATP:cob(I)alamin adenosyltransferase [Chloroflexi bacterium]|nr:ATP:cob(I)alamin adenosyltransferase [Chloroflexota bacterium]
MGLARAEAGELAAAERLPRDLAQLSDLIVRLQRGLFVVGAELASNPDAWDRLRDGTTRVDEPMLVAVEADLAALEGLIEMPREFIVPGASRLSAALELARTILRRAERRAVSLRRDGRVAGPWLVPYLNRVADLLWVMARAAEQGEQRASITARVRPE